MTAREAQRNFGELEPRARKEPLEITRHGRRYLVVMTPEQYDWLWAKAKRSLRTEETPDTIIEAIRRTRMHPRHNHLNKLLEEE